MVGHARDPQRRLGMAPVPCPLRRTTCLLGFEEA